MSEMVVDSSVVAKWILPEADSPKAHRLITQAALTGDRLLVLDLVFPEVANAIWKRQRRGLITLDEARQFLGVLKRLPIEAVPVLPLLDSAYEIAAKYDRAVYDALFIASMQERRATGITADEPLFNTTQRDFPQLSLLRNM